MDDVAGPVLTAIKAAYGTTALAGLATGLVVHDLDGWTPAAGLTGARLVDAAQRRWPAQPHVTAALLWRAYSLWLSVPAAFAWVAARRVPHLTAADVLVRLDAPIAPVRLGLRSTHLMSVLPTDPLAAHGPVLPTDPLATHHPALPTDPLAAHGPALPTGRPAVHDPALLPGGPPAGGRRVSVVPDEAALLVVLRRTMLDEHVTPVLDALQGTVRISRRLLLGSLAAGLAHAARHAVRVVPGASPNDVGALLTGLSLDHLVDWTTDAAGLVSIRRRTCCLAFTLPQPRFCGDCCYLPPSPS